MHNKICSCAAPVIASKIKTGKYRGAAMSLYVMMSLLHFCFITVVTGIYRAVPIGSFKLPFVQFDIVKKRSWKLISNNHRLIFYKIFVSHLYCMGNFGKNNFLPYLRKIISIGAFLGARRQTTDQQKKIIVYPIYSISTTYSTLHTIDMYTITVLIHKFFFRKD